MTLDQFTDLYEREYDTLIWAAKKQLMKTPQIKSETPDDIVQNVVVKMLEGELYEGVDEVAGVPYLRAGIVNHIMNLQQSAFESQAPGLDAIKLSMSTVNDARDLERELELRELIDQTIATFANLNIREALRLMYLEGWDAAGAAEKTGTDYAHVRKNMERFRERLRAKKKRCSR